MKIDDKLLDEIRSQFTWRRGNIYKRNINGNDILVEEDVLFQYDTANKCFIREEDICYASLYFEAIIDGNLKREEEIKALLKEHYLYTDIPYIDGVLYIDKSSVYEVKNSRGRK